MIDRWILAATVAALAACSSGDPAGPDASPGRDSGDPADVPPGPYLATVAIDESAVGARLAEDYLGLGIEFESVGSYLGRRPDQPNTVFRQLLANLGKGTLRIGGNSTDTGCWRESPGAPLEPICDLEISQNSLDIIAGTTVATGWRAVVGLNLARGDVGVALDYARDGLAVAFEGAIRPGLLAIEIGNEPNLYMSSGLRPADYDHPDFIAEWSQHADALRGDAITADMPLAGPAYTRRSSWYALLDDFLVGVGDDRLDLATMQVYPLSRCFGTEPSVADLLSDETLEAARTVVAAAADSARAHGKALQVSESASVACGGTDGVSNVFASALWAVSHLLVVAEAGAARTNLHMRRYAYYDPVVSLETENPDGSFSYDNRVLPSYYAMWLVSRAVGGDFVATTVDGPIRAHTVAGANGELSVFLVNRSETEGGLVRVTPSAVSAGQSEVITLRAPSLRARVSELRLGGVFVDEATGLLPAPTTTTATYALGTYYVQVPATSAVLLTID